MRRSRASSRPLPRRRGVLLLSGCLLALPACAAPDPRAAATIEMAERLAALAREVEAREHPYAMSRTDGGDRADATLPEGSVEARMRAAREALRAGDTQAGTAALHDVVVSFSSGGAGVSGELGLAVIEMVALAHLRLWTEANCVAATEWTACTFPRIRPVLDPTEAGVALEVYTSLQEARPGNLAVRWLLNLSAMMAGRYPDAVPAELRLPASVVDSVFPFPTFPDRAPALGVDVTGHAGGAVLDDLDADGDLDLAVTSWHLTDPIRLFRNDGAAGFTEITKEAGLEGITGGLHLVQTDYDNDGWIDLFVLRGAWTGYGEPNSLLRNRGDGSFEEVTAAAGLLESHPTQVGVWADYDGDGRLDLFVGHESSGDRVIPSRLFHNNGDGSFTDLAVEAGVDVVGFVKGAAWGDVDNDGRPDLYVSRLHEPNLLFRNAGPGPDGVVTFHDITEEAGVAEPLASFPTWFWDYDNDGWLDLFVSGYQGTLADVAAEYLGLPHQGETPRLYRNRGDGSFEDVTSSVGLDRVLLTMGANFGDFDNDGFLDLYAGTGEANLQTIVPNRAFRNAAGRVFREVTTEGGFGHLGKGHGVAFGDIDADGDQDLHVTMGGAYPSDTSRNLFHMNPGGNHHWITLTLQGGVSNRPAIGARIRVVVAATDGTEREIHRVVGSGSSFGGNSLAVEIGLGDAAEVRSVEIRWPAGGVERFTEVARDRRYRVVEGRGRLDPVGS
ncbi:MAG: CRTAC1 family protein [Longimicrobiales bacterium]|nr:CRTAC1 family protein [Longimicrobiales bacterium]